jgi:hypothetical protein
MECYKHCIGIEVDDCKPLLCKACMFQLKTAFLKKHNNSDRTTTTVYLPKPIEKVAVSLKLIEIAGENDKKFERSEPDTEQLTVDMDLDPTSSRKRKKPKKVLELVEMDNLFNDERTNNELELIIQNNDSSDLIKIPKPNQTEETMDELPPIACETDEEHIESDCEAALCDAIEEETEVIELIIKQEPENENVGIDMDNLYPDVQIKTEPELIIESQDNYDNDYSNESVICNDLNYNISIQDFTGK